MTSSLQLQRCQLSRDRFFACYFKLNTIITAVGYDSSVANCLWQLILSGTESSISGRFHKAVALSALFVDIFDVKEEQGVICVADGWYMHSTWSEVPILGLL
jgi:hypothetical protein